MSQTGSPQRSERDILAEPSVLNPLTIYRDGKDKLTEHGPLTYYMIPPPGEYSRCDVLVSDEVAWRTTHKSATIIRTVAPDEVDCSESTLFDEHAGQVGEEFPVNYWSNAAQVGLIHRRNNCT